MTVRTCFLFTLATLHRTAVYCNAQPRTALVVLDSASYAKPVCVHMCPYKFALQHLLRSIHTLCNTLCMTVSFIGGGGTHIPQWDMQDRLGKSLRDSGLSVAQAAEYFGVHRNTVSGWMHGRIKPDTRTLRLWAMMTNVPYEWLVNGTEHGPDGGSRLGESNPPPIHYKGTEIPLFDGLIAA